MSEQFKSIAVRSGFSKVLGNEASQFILFDRDTDGRSGRRLYINGALASKFTGMSPTAADTVFAKIKQLKATAGGIGSYSNLNNAMEHMTVVGSVGVRYKIFQSTGQKEYRAGIYITDLDLGHFEANDRPGLYRVRRQNKQWQPSEEPVQSIETTLAAVNGLTESRISAAGVLPHMLESAYGGSDLRSDGYTLCFNPPTLYKYNRKWLTPTQKRVNKAVIAAHLKEALLDAQHRKRKVQWVIHSDGAQVLHDALHAVGGRDLSCHTMIVLSPTQKKLSHILPLIRRSNISLHQDVTKVQNDDWRSKMTQMWDGRNIERELAQIPGHEARGTILRREARDTIHDAAKHLASSFAGGLAIGSFLLNPAAPGMVAIGGAIAGAYGSYRKAKSLRNIAMNNSVNPNLNPHMHPFKNDVEMDIHATKHSGNAVKTFVDAARVFIKR